MVNYCSTYIINHKSPVSYQVVGHTKTVLVVLFDRFLVPLAYGMQVTGINAQALGGLALALAGAVSYQMVDL